MGLYPATVKQPATAFTFRALDNFLLANKISGNAAQSYFERLRRLTSPSFPDDVPVSSIVYFVQLAYNGPRIDIGSCFALVVNGEI